MYIVLVIDKNEQELFSVKLIGGEDMDSYSIGKKNIKNDGLLSMQFSNIYIWKFLYMSKTQIII